MIPGDCGPTSGGLFHKSPLLFCFFLMAGSGVAQPPPQGFQGGSAPLAHPRPPAAAPPPGGPPPHVEVLVDGDDDRVVVQVGDSGPGVPDGDEVFRQGWSTKSIPGDGGRGFGLALVRLVCRRRGGDVTLRNDGGAVFTATLPLGAADAAEAGLEGSEGSVRAASFREVGR